MLSSANELVGNHPKFLKTLEHGRNVAITKTPVIIVGEPGTGKRTLANYIHANSARQNNRFEVVDCSKEASQVEKDILGYRDEESGRFHRGVLERANGGSVVFAHIDCLSEDFQKRLYTIFQELPDYEIDLRLMGTTTKNLSKLVGAGKFSRPLLTFFSGTQIDTTPLRERGADIEAIAKHVLSQISDESQTAYNVDEVIFQKMNSFSWSQNISELKSFVKNCAKNSDNGVIDLKTLEQGEQNNTVRGLETDEEGLKLMSLKEAEKLLIRKALVFTSENRTQAAKILGVSIRTLRNKINEYRTEGSQYFVNLR